MADDSRDRGDLGRLARMAAIASVLAPVTASAADSGLRIVPSTSVGTHTETATGSPANPNERHLDYTRPGQRPAGSWVYDPPSDGDVDGPDSDVDGPDGDDDTSSSDDSPADDSPADDVSFDFGADDDGDTSGP